MDVDNVSKDYQKEYVATTQKRMMAMHFILNANHDRYGELIKEYDCAYLGGGAISIPPTSTVLTYYSRTGAWGSHPRR